MDVNNNMLRLIDPDNERALGESFIHLLASPSLLALLYQWYKTVFQWWNGISKIKGKYQTGLLSMRVLYY